MSNTKKHKKKAKEKKIRDFHALNAIQRKAGAEKNKEEKRKATKTKKTLEEELAEWKWEFSGD